MSLIDARNATYSADDIERGLLAMAIVGDNSLKASDQTGIPSSTLREWRKQHAERYTEIRQQLAPQVEQQIVQEARATILRAGEAEREALQATRDAIRNGTIKDPSSALRNISTSKALNADKIVFPFEGRPTTIIEHRNSDDILRSLEAKGYIDTTATELTATTEATVPGKASDTPRQIKGANPAGV